MDKVEFEKWADREGLDLTSWSIGYFATLTSGAFKGWNARQPEIDAQDKTIDDLALQKGILKAEIGRQKDEIDALKQRLDFVINLKNALARTVNEDDVEIDALKTSVAELVAEIERLKCAPAPQEFTVWWQRFLFDHGGWRFTCEEAALAAFNAHKSEIAVINMVADTAGDVCKLLRKENAALKAEVDRLRAAAPTPPEQENQWQKAVLNECFAIEGCYKESDPVGTLACLINWHVLNERDHASAQEAEPVKPYWPPVQEAIKDYLDGYALDDGEVYHEPNEIESLLIHDAIAGLLGDDKFKAEYQTWLRSTNNTHAPSDKLRQAAEELVEHFTSVQLPPDCTAFVRVEKLRDALEGKS